MKTTTKKKRYPKNNFDPLTSTPGGGTIWRDCDNPGWPVVTHGTQTPLEAREEREKQEKRRE
jgi:hypothetical protein